MDTLYIFNIVQKITDSLAKKNYFWIIHQSKQFQVLVNKQKNCVSIIDLINFYNIGTNFINENLTKFV